MYDSILVPVDLSDSNEQVLRRAVELGDPDESTVTLLHVIEMVEDISLDDDEDFYAELRDNADEKMSRWASQVAEHGFDVTAEITYGKRAQEIVRVAGEQPSDLVVMRSHVIDPDEADSQERLGTVSHQVALFAPCSVLVVRESA
jgi:nucleotide-binding universal stress UspA family protein